MSLLWSKIEPAVLPVIEPVMQAQRPRKEFGNHSQARVQASPIKKQNKSRIVTTNDNRYSTTE